MSKVSVIIPSRDEIFLNGTVEHVFAAAAGDVEVIAIIDGPTSYPLPDERPNLCMFRMDVPSGMRHGINAGALLARGDYLLKLDAHCELTQGFDEILQKDCDKDWVVISRRAELSQDFVVSEPIADYFYMSSPWTSPNGYMRMSRWITRDRQRKDVMLDETMTMSGSMWFMSKRHFFDRIRKMDEDRFGQWSGEPEELCCKTWLGGGKVMLNKNVTHAHLRKDKIGRPYKIEWSDALAGLQMSALYWASDQWPYRIHNFEWLVDHFWPLPSKAHHCNGERYFWEDDWKKTCSIL